MANFTFATEDLTGLTLEAGYALWREREGVIDTFSGYHARGGVAPGAHWDARDVGTGGLGNQGFRVLVPRSPEARRLVRLHTIEVWVNELGLTERQARELYALRVPYKRELLGRLKELAQDHAAMAALAAFPGVGPGLHARWAEKWGGVVDDHTEGLSWPRIESLAEMAKAMA